MNHFQPGEQLRIFKHGVHVDVVAFRQLGEFVYVFDEMIRMYQYRISDVVQVNTNFGASQSSAQPR